MIETQEFVCEAREYTKNTLVNSSFQLADPTSHPDDLVLVRRRASPLRRVPYHEVCMGPCQDEVRSDM